MIEKVQEDVPDAAGEAVKPESSKPTAVDFIRLVLVPVLFSVLAARLLLWGGLLTVVGLGFGVPAYLAVRRRTLRSYAPRPGLGTWVATLTDAPMTSYRRPQLRVVGTVLALGIVALAGVIVGLTVYAESASS